MSEFYFNTIAIKENIKTLKNNSTYYAKKKDTFTSGAFNSGGCAVGSYLNKINMTYAKIANNTNNLIKYLENYADDIENIENVMSNTGYGNISVSAASTKVFQNRNRMKKYNIPDEDIFPINTVDASSLASANSGIAVNVDNPFGRVNSSGKTNIGNAMPGFNTAVFGFDHVKREGNSAEYKEMCLGDYESWIEKVNSGDISAFSLGKLDLNKILDGYIFSIQNQIDLFQPLLDDVNKKIEARDELESRYSEIEDWQNQYEVNLRERAGQYRQGMISEEKIKELGLDKYNFNKTTYTYDLTIDEMVEIIKEKDSETIAAYRELNQTKKELDNDTKRLTGYTTYAEFASNFEKLEQDQYITSATIKKLENQMAMAPYTLLPFLDDYQNYKNSDDIKTPLEKVGTFSSDKIKNLAEAIEVNEDYAEMGNIYNYLYETEGEKAANEYLNAIEDSVNQILGQKKANEFLESLSGETKTIINENGEEETIRIFSDSALTSISDHLKITGKGLGEGVQSFGEGLAAWIKSSDVYSADEYERMYILDALSKGENSFLYSNNFEISQSIGNMAPTIALSIVLSSTGVGEAYAAGAAGAAMGTSAGGNSYHQALVEGYSQGQSIMYGALNGLSEAGLEMVIGGLTGISDVKVTNFLTYLQASAKEGNEEALQEVVDAISRKAIFGEDIEWSDTFKAALKSGAYGAITADILNGASLTVNAGISGINSYLNSNVNSFNQIVNTKNMISERYKNLHQEQLNAIKDGTINKIKGIPNQVKETAQKYANNFNEFREHLNNRVENDANNSTTETIETLEVNNVEETNNIKNIGEKAKNAAVRGTKTVGGFTGVLAAQALNALGPIGTMASIPLTLKSISLIQDGVFNNNINNSFLMTEDRIVKTENGYEKIAKLYQNVFAFNDFIKSRFSDNPQEYFLIRSLNAFQQLNKNQKYATTSQANTYMLLRQIQKLGFIKNLTKTESKKQTNLAFERFYLGVKQRERAIKMYDLSFETTDKTLDSATISDILKLSKVDLSKYDIKTDSKGNTILDLRINDKIKEKFNPMLYIDKIKEKLHRNNIETDITNTNSENIETLEVDNVAENTVEKVEEINANTTNNISEEAKQAFEKLQMFFDTDLKVKEIMSENAPNAAYQYNQEYISQYSDNLLEMIKDLKFYFKKMSKVIDISDTYINDLFNNYEIQLAECGLNFNKLKKFYNDYISDMSDNIINLTRENFAGYSIDAKEAFSSVLGEAKTVNEVLHVLHSYITNDNDMYTSMPTIDSKTNSNQESITLYGEDNEIARSFFNSFPTNEDSNITDIISLKNKLLVMVRDRGHALTIEINYDENGKAYIDYFIPKICNADKVNKLTGVRKVSSDAPANAFTTGYFETTLDNLNNDIYDFIKNVPTDDDMVFPEFDEINATTENTISQVTENSKLTPEVQSIADEFSSLNGFEAENNFIENILFNAEKVDNETLLAVVDNLIDTGKINQLTNGTIATLAKKSTEIFHKIAVTDKFYDLIYKNLTKTITVPLIQKLNNDEFSNIFNDPKIQKIINEKFQNEIFNYDTSEFINFVKSNNLERLFEKQVEKGNFSNYKNFLEIISKNYNLEILKNNDGYAYQVKKLLKIETTDKSINDIKSNLIKISQEYDDLYNAKLQLFQKYCNFEVKVNDDGELVTVNQYDDSYYDIVLEVNGEEQILTISPDFKGIINLSNLFKRDQRLLSKLFDDQIKIKSINKNKFTVTGLEPGLNQIEVKVDDQVQKIIYSNDVEVTKKNIQDILGKNVQNLEVIKVTPLGTYDIQVDNPNMVYKVKLTLENNEVKTFYTYANGKNKLDIDSYIEANNITSITNVETSIVETDNYDIDFSIYNTPQSKEIYNSNKYGGNQSDVRSLVNKLSSDIEQIEILNNLIDKYYPGLTASDKNRLASRYVENGCAYMAIANAFITYMNNQTNGQNIFEQKFGYKLKNDQSGSYNTAALAFEMYLDVTKSEFENINQIFEKPDDQGLNAPMIITYIKPFFNKYNIELNFSTAKDIHSFDSIVYSNEVFSSFAQLLNHPHSFNILSSSHFNMEFLNVGEKLIQPIDGTLENSSNKNNIKENVGSHAMLITDIDSEGNLIVSSWGKKYKVDLNSINQNKIKFNFKDGDLNIWSLDFNMAPEENIESINNAQTTEELNSKESTMERVKLSNEKTLTTTDFTNLSTEEQIDYITNANREQLDDILKDINVSSIDSKVVNEIENKIIANQDIIFSRWDSMNTMYIKPFVQNNPNLLTKLSNASLISLLNRDAVNVLEELNNRINKGENILDFQNYKHKFMGLEMNDVNALNPLVNKYDTATAKIIENIKAKLALLPEDIKLISYKINDIVSQSYFIEEYLNGDIDQKGLDLMNELLTENPNRIEKMNFALLNQKYIDTLSQDYIKSIINDYETSSKLVTLNTKYPNLYNSFVKILNDFQNDNSLYTFYAKANIVLDFIYNNADKFTNLNSDILENDNFVNYAIYMSNRSMINTIEINEYSADYEIELNQKCDEQFSNLIQEINNSSVPELYMSYNLEKMKDCYFTKYFSLPYNKVKDLITKYKESITTISQNDPHSTTILEFLEYIASINDYEKLNDIYQNQTFKLSSEEMLYLDDSLRKAYVKTYVDKLGTTSNYINNEIIANSSLVETLNYNGHEIKMLNLNDDFAFIVRSSESGLVVENRELAEDSYKKSWEYTDDASNHLLAASYITSENIGSCPVNGTGVLYGFTNIQEDDLMMMGPADINSNINNVGYGSGQQQRFVSADEMSNYTTRIYNEFVLEKANVKPDCIIVYTDFSPELMNNAYKAAAEWNIPIIKIDKTQLAENNNQKINNHLNEFSQTKNLEELESALNLYESNVSGFKLNTYVEEGTTDMTANIDNSYVKELGLFDSQQIETNLQQALDYFKTLDNNSEMVDNYIEILKQVQYKYDITNDMSNSLLANSKSDIDYNAYIEEALKIRK